MPIDLTAAQAERIASLAHELGNRLSLHQVAGADEVYVGTADEQGYVITATGEANETDRIPAGG